MIISTKQLKKINIELEIVFNIEKIKFKVVCNHGNIVVCSSDKTKPNIKTIIDMQDQTDFKDYEELQEWVLMKTQNWIEKSCLVERKLICN